MSRYTVEITIRDNLLEDTVFIERNSDDQTWPWMANTMFDALRGASFVLPDNIDFPSISEMTECLWDEEDPRSDGSPLRPYEEYADEDGWILHDPAIMKQPVADDVEVVVKHSDGYTTPVWPARWFCWDKEDLVAWRYAKTDAADENIGYGGTD